jgi:hypothetical protein
MPSRFPFRSSMPEFVAEDKEPEPVDIPDEKELGKKKPEKTSVTFLSAKRKKFVWTMRADAA